MAATCFCWVDKGLVKCWDFIFLCRHCPVNWFPSLFNVLFDEGLHVVGGVHSKCFEDFVVHKGVVFSSFECVVTPCDRGVGRGFWCLVREVFP